MKVIRDDFKYRATEVEIDLTHAPLDVVGEWAHGGFPDAIRELVRRKLNGSRTLTHTLTRANPYHDEKGKFTTGPGGGSTKDGHRPGAWKKPTTEQVTDRLAGMIAQDMHDASWSFGSSKFTLSMAKARERAQVAAKEIIDRAGPAKALINGDSWIMAGAGLAVSDKEMARIADLVDGHQTANPVPDGQSTNVYIQNSFTMSDLGQTEVHTGNITLNSWVVGEGPADRGDRQNMPSAQKVSSLEYTIAHEWGHTQHQENDPVADKLWNPKDPNLSLYAQDGGMFRTSHEAYAECYAEYTLTKGQTTNPTVLKYASTFGWKV